MAAGLTRARIAVLGCGAVGSAFAADLLDREFSRFRGALVLWSRRAESVRRLEAELSGSGRQRRRVLAAATPAAAVAGADVALVCVSDEALPALARELARGPRPVRRGPAVLVASGSFPLSRLAGLRRARFAVGRLHPLAPFVERRSANGVYLAPFAIAGDARALSAARDVVELLDGMALPLRAGARAASAYHAGAALLGGGLVALLAQVEEVVAPHVGVERAKLRRALHRFAGSVGSNYWLEGAEAALTGPLARGSEAVVRAHLAALRATPRALVAYRVLGETMIALAGRRGSLGAAARRRLLGLLRGRR